MVDDRVKQFLSRISQLETSGGKNLNHKVITDGLQSGQKAIGRYGLLNNTIQEVLNRKRMAGDINPDLAALRNQDQEAVRAALTERPELEDEIAGSLAERILDRNEGNDAAAAYSWLNGSNLAPERITTDKLVNSDYVQKYQKLLNAENIEAARKQALERIGTAQEPAPTSLLAAIRNK